MLKGTTTRSAAQIAEDSEMLGGTISASVGGDSFGWSFSVTTQRLPEALELLGEVVQRPTIPADAFETERAVALSNVAMLRDDMYRYPMRLASSVAFPKHPYGVPPMGTEESLRALTAEQGARVAQVAGSRICSGDRHRCRHGSEGHHRRVSE
jgi:zinc protease